MNCCYNSSYYEKKFKKIKNRKKVAIFFILAFFIVFLSILFLKNTINPIILSYGEIEIKRLVSISCNEAISVVGLETKYEDLINIVYNEDGSIAMIKSNPDEVNKISNSLAQEAQSEIDKNAKVGFQISIGTLSGIGLLSGKGSKINFYINPKGSVLCHFYSVFTSAGINQTCHKIYVNIETVCYLILPFGTKNFESKIDFLIAECLIIGNVPNTYLNVSNLDDLK